MASHFDESIFGQQRKPDQGSSEAYDPGPMGSCHAGSEGGGLPVVREHSEAPVHKWDNAMRRSSGADREMQEVEEHEGEDAEGGEDEAASSTERGGSHRTAGSPGASAMARGASLPIPIGGGPGPERSNSSALERPTFGRQILNALGVGDSDETSGAAGGSSAAAGVSPKTKKVPLLERLSLGSAKTAIMGGGPGPWRGTFSASQLGTSAPCKLSLGDPLKSADLSLNERKSPKSTTGFSLKRMSFGGPSAKPPKSGPLPLSPDGAPPSTPSGGAPSVGRALRTVLSRVSGRPVPPRAPTASKPLSSNSVPQTAAYAGRDFEMEAAAVAARAGGLVGRKPPNLKRSGYYMGLVGDYRTGTGKDASASSGSMTDTQKAAQLKGWLKESKEPWSKHSSRLLRLQRDELVAEQAAKDKREAEAASNGAAAHAAPLRAPMKALKTLSLAVPKTRAHP
ncbi:hypothetical protein FOA52_011464 [Chlamydomonas sp. UWO 241]|nr:hypothetical protein FOA52_011464 [Chlamydomonas sp. UWO 241]